MKSILLMITTGELRRVLLHIPLGLLTVLFGCYVSWWLAAILTIGFLVYEVNTDWHISDGAYKDIKGFIWGLAIGGLVFFGLKIGGVI